MVSTLIEAQRQHHREGAQQRDRCDQRWNQRVAPVLQEQVHHREHQQHRLQQRLHHLLDRDLDERRGVERNARFHAARQQRRQFGHALTHRRRGTHRVRARTQLHAGGGGRMAILAGAPGIALRAQFNAGDIAQHHPRAVGPGAQHDGSELLRRGQLAIGTQRHGDALAWNTRRITNASRRDLQVLLLDGGGHIAHGQAVAGQPGRVQPHAHRLLGTEQLHAADAIDAAQLLDDVARHEVAQCGLADAGIRRTQADQHQEAGIGGLHEQAVLAHAARRRGSIALIRFCTSTCASSGLVPGEGRSDRGFAGGVH